MDRLVKPDVEELKLPFITGQKCCANFKLTNLMHTMPVAISVTTNKPSLFSFSLPFSIIPPLSTSAFTISLSNPSDRPPLSSPLDSVLVRSSMLPTGKANHDDLRRLFSRPGPHIFKDAKILISFVGSQVVEFLLSTPSKTLEVSFLLTKALSRCDKSQLGSLLKHAVKKGNSYSVSALIEAGADVNFRDSDGSSAMELAIQRGNIDALQVLIESGFEIDESSDRPLHDAAAIGCVDMMEILCLGFVDIDLNSVDSRGQTPLHVASINGHVEALQFLVSIGSDPEITDHQGWTALHFAAYKGHVEAVEFLLNHSTFIKSAITKTGKTAFDLAVEKGHKDLYDMLKLSDVLHRAARIDDVHAMKSCLAEGANVNGRDQNGWTPLHRAAFKGRIESVKLLMSHGAKVDVVDDHGYTPVHRAMEAGNLEVASYLIAHGATAKSVMKEMASLVDLGCLKNPSSFVCPYSRQATGKRQEIIKKVESETTRLRL